MTETVPPDRPEGWAAVERDGGECQYCGDGATRAYPVGGAAADGPVTERTLVAVCDGCVGLLGGDRPVVADSPEALFRAVRDLTRAQGDAIADVADFASTATSLPATLEAGETPSYAADRRVVVLTLDAIDAQLAAVDGVAVDDDPEAARALAAFLDRARRLQGELRTLVDRVEAVATGLDRCHACFERLDGVPACPACGADRLAIGGWRADDGSVAFDALFGAVTDGLGDAADTTDEVTERATVLAESLVGS